MSSPTKCFAKAKTELSEKDYAAFVLPVMKSARAIIKSDALGHSEAATKAVEDRMLAVRAAIARLTGLPEAEPELPQEPAPKEKKAPKAPKVIDNMAELIDGSDAQAIADAAYEGVREAEPEDFPIVLADDRLIRMPVLIAEREKVEANLKKLKFRVTDRAQESGTDGRMLISAIYRPETGGIGDVGEKMGGGRKDQDPPKLPPKDADEKALDEFLAALHKSKHLDANANTEQTFGAMMFKEGIIDNVSLPLAYIGGVLKNQFDTYYYEKSPRVILKAAMANDKHREKVQSLADGYVQRLTLLQKTLTAGNRVGEVATAMRAAYANAELGSSYNNADGKALDLISGERMLRKVDTYELAFGPTEDTTDQTHRVIKKDPDVPPRLERIVRIGMKDHRGGKPVVDQDFLDVFGFKGLEFGNWVNQTERQENMNLAYDSLMDMADLTGFTPKALGLMQRLGFAIGSRGTNPRAAAHFEPGNNVINLTKTKGNGTVGHEWFHALDHNAQALQDVAGAPDAGRQMRRAVNTLAEALKTRINPEAGDDYLRGLLRQSATDSARNTPPKQAVFDAISGGEYGRRYGRLPDAYRQVTQPTGFYTNAKRMDEGSSKAYWSTPVELLARGFETYLFDESKGGSPYLVGPSRGDGVMTPANGYSGVAYPTGKEREYVGDLFDSFLQQIDPETLQFKPYKPAYTITELPGLGWVALDQNDIDVSNGDGRMTIFKDKAEATAATKIEGRDTRYLDAERIAYAALNASYVKFALNIDAIMEEMGLERWPELKNGSMAESMLFHLRQGWWPKDNQALKVYAAKAFGIQPKEVDLLKLKQAQEDFEAALGRYAAQRVVDMRNTGADSSAIYDYLVGLYQTQPNLDVRTGTSQANMAFSTPIPIGFVAGMMGHVSSKTSVFDATGGNGLLAVSVNPKRLVTIELEPARANNLRLMEYGKVIEGDATKLIDSAIRAQEADTLLFNPPFGALAQSVGVPSWDGRTYMMGKIDQLIAAKGMKAMADKGRAVIILGAHKNPSTVTSSDRVFLNWLYSNYNVVDHFEVDGDLYTRQGASWPLRILVVAGRKESVSAFPTETIVDRVYDFDQLWSRSDEARKRAEQVLVGAGVKSDEAGGADQPGVGVPAGNSGKAAGAGGVGGVTAGSGKDGDVADGLSGSGSPGNGRPGKSGGSTAGDGERGGNGEVGGSGNGATGNGGGSNRGSGGAGRTAPGGLSDLSDDDLDALIGGAINGDKKARAPKAEGGTTAGPSGSSTTPRVTGKAKAKLGASVLDGIPGLSDLLSQLGNQLGIESDSPPPDDTPTPPQPKERKKRETAIERRERLIAERTEQPEEATAFFKPDADAPLQLSYTKSSPLTENGLNILLSHQHSQKTLARSIRAALDYQLEQDQNPTASAERVSSRAMFSRQMNEDGQYAKVQPILSAIWQHLTTAIADLSQRIKTLAIGAAQKFGNSVVPFVKRFLQDVRSEQQTVPSGKKPIHAEAIDSEAQVVYRGRSGGDSAGIFVPRNQATALERSFDAFEADNGEVDPFVMNELGYKSVEQMHKGLAGYQVDALALAISSMKRGDGFIIGDDTGVGKGRTAAAVIAWAAKNGKVPIFFSYKADLYSAMHDDLTDIGMVDRVKPMPTDSDAVIRDRNGKTILKNNAKQAKKDLEHVIKNGAMPDGQNAIFTTYFQNNTANLRRQAIQRLVADGKAVLIMDEAHNAAGDSSTNAFFMGLLTGQGLFGGSEKDGYEPAPDDWVAPQSVYLTATFAKRPSNMPVYIRTQLRHAANTPKELIDLFGSGGDVLQQIASEMLVSSGSMIRRERSYAGVKFNYVTDEANAPRDAREVDAATEVLRRIVYADRAFGAWVKTPEGQAAVKTLVPPGFAATFSGSGADTAINKSEFTSVVHNYVGQLLLATKVAKSVESAVEALNAGQKPVLTLQNTMEAALNDYVGMEGISEGDPLTGYGWQSILQRGLTSARRVVFDAGTGNKRDNLRIMVPTEFMPAFISAEFKKAAELIAKFKSELPGSPIDALRHRLSEYHIVETKGADGQIVYSATKTPAPGSKSRPLVVVEVTGREFGVDYSTPVPTYMKREDPDNLEIIRGFQGGTIDVVILNSSGSTGISLHASEKAKDQRPRHMIVMQPNPDIAVFKQTTGRIHRTGQVEWPTFTILATGIPAERRMLAILKKKIGSLFSNTSSGEGTTSVDAVDFINQYGDVITAEYLNDNPEVAAFIGVTVPTEPSGSDIARKASGRAALLSVDDQRDYFDTIEQQFLMEIEQRNATGTNALARRAADFQAASGPGVPDTVSQVLEEGMDESNPFTASAYMTKYSVNVVGDIPSAAKVREAVASSLDGKTASDVLSALVKSLETRYDESRNQLVLRRSETVADLSKEGVTEQDKTALTALLVAIDSKIQSFSGRREQTIRALSQNYAIGNGVRSVTVGDVDASAVIVAVTLIKVTSKSGNPFSPSNIKIHLQRNIPDGRLSVPLSKLESGEYQTDGFTRHPNIDEWFALHSATGGKALVWIAHGNLLRARAILNGGEILLHTMNGSTKESPIIQGGIKMPPAYAPGAESRSDFTIRYPGAAVDYVLALQRSAISERAARYGDEDKIAEAKAFADAARFQVEISAEDRKAIAQSGAVLGGPKRGWTLDMSAYDGRLTLYVGKDFPRIIRSKALTALLGAPMAKKRNDSMYEARIPTDPEKLKALVKILAQNSPLVAPDAAADIARTLSQQHFQADNNRKGDAPAASRTALRGGMAVESVQSLVDAVTSNWEGAPQVIVASSMQDTSIPKAVRDEDLRQTSQGASGAPEGFFHKGIVYLLADQINSDADAVRVLFHESLGHFGLRGTFGEELSGILDRLSALNASKVRAKAKQYGLDFENEADRRAAAEEVLADMAMTEPELGWVKKAIAAIRTFLREHVAGFEEMGLSDAEIIRDYILPARRFVTDGGPKGGSSTTRPVFSRSIGESLTAGMNNARDVKLAAGYTVGDLFNSYGRINWWHKSVGTMHNLAERSPPFKRVYDAIQNFLNDVSYYAAEAADLAPRILPKLESWKDILKTPMSPEDTKALSAPVFEGTLSWGRDEKGVARPMIELEAELGATELDDKAHMLMRAGHIAPNILRMWQGLPMGQYETIINGKFEKHFLKAGVVFTPAELKKHFKLTDEQVSLYQEFRAATDKSIQNLAISDMLKFGGKDTATMRDAVLAAATIEDAGILLRDKLFELAAADPSRADALNADGNTMMDKVDKAQGLIDKGYAPLSRFGQYTLDVLDEDGERVYFSLFESAAERSKMARKMATMFPNATISTGAVSEEAYKLFAGVSPETLELFGEMLGLESEGSDETSKAFQAYLKLAKSSRSSMKRLIERKGTAGFSEDAGRVLAGFVYSNARQTASNLHMGEIDRGITEIPKGDGQISDAAVQLRDYVKNPQEEAQAFRAMLFAQYLGGSVASAMVNATQPFAVTLPYLSQFGGITKAARQMAAAVRDATKDTTGDDALDKALKKAEEEGIVAPQEVHSLMAQAMGRAQLRSGDGTTSGDLAAKANNARHKLSLAWGKVFGVAEQFNRRTTFIAAYRTAIERGMADPAAFAEKAVADTQFTYNKGNKPKWARGAVGSILFTFKQYGINYVELLVRMGTAGEPGSEERRAGQKAALLALAILFLMAGADGLPFMEDAQDVIDGAMQRLGYSFSTKKELKSFLTEQLGKGGAEFVLNGASGIPGMPIDFSGRTSMGNLLPGTGLALKKTDHTRDFMEFLGAGGDLVKRGFEAAGQLTSGEAGGAVKTALPKAAANLIQAYDMASTDMYRDARGYKVVSTTPGEALAKAIGFQPRDVKEVQSATMQAQREKSQYILVSSEIRAAWAKGIFENDSAQVAEARADLAAWNEKNPTQRISANMPVILSRVREMRKTKQQRVADTAPKAIRNKVREQLSEELTEN